MQRISILLLAVLTAIGLPVATRAQIRPEAQQVLALVGDAMNDYSNLALDDSLAKLNQALEIAFQTGVTGAPLARVYVSMGIVQAGGFMNNAEALDAFKKALCIDPKIQPDPLVSTPDIQTTFMLARTQSKGPGACQALGGETTPPPGPVPIEPPIEAPPIDAISPPGCAVHTFVAEQTRMHPVPIYVELDPGVEASMQAVTLYFKNEGETQYQQVEMTKRGPGYGAKIDCDNIQAFDPRFVYYFVMVTDIAGLSLCSVADAENPHLVQMVDQLSGEAPAFPDGAPEQRCETCPPWDTTCGKGMATTTGKLGDACNEMNLCSEGLECIDGICDESDSASSGEKVVHIDLGFGTGAGIVSQSMKLPYDPYHLNDTQRSVDVGGGFAWSPMQARIGFGVFVMEGLSVDANFRMNLYFNKRTEYLCEEEPEDPETPCEDWLLTEDGESYQTREIVEPMAWLLTFRARYIYFNTGGLDLYAWGGLGYGSIKHRVVFQDSEALTDDGMPSEMKVFPESGMFDISIGPGLAYYVADMFGLMLELPLDILMPDFAFNLDVNVGFQMRF